MTLLKRKRGARKRNRGRELKEENGTFVIQEVASDDEEVDTLMANDADDESGGDGQDDDSEDDGVDNVDV